MTQRVSAPWTPDFELRNVAQSDLPIFYEQQRDPQANQMAAFPPRERDAFMAHWTKILADKMVQARTIVLDGQVAGNIVSWEQAINDASRFLTDASGYDFLKCANSKR